MKISTKILRELHKMRDLLDARIREMNDIYASKSEKWKNSAWAYDFNEDFKTITDLREEIDGSIDALRLSTNKR